MDFTVNHSLIYLNSGTFSLTPLPVLEALTRYEREFEGNPTENLIQAWSKLWQVQQDLASFFNADPCALFLRPNVTSTLNDFLLGIPLPKTGTLVTTDLEYGAISNILRFRAESENRPLTTVSLPVQSQNPSLASSSALIDHIISQIPREACLLLISHIMTGTGLKIPLLELARALKKTHPDCLLAIDGAHGPGAVPIDFSHFENIDFYGGNLHKWFLGPKGTAFGWVHPKHHDTIVPRYAGWTTFETSGFFKPFGDGKRFPAKMLDSACNHFASYYAIKDTIVFINGLSLNHIFKNILDLRTEITEVMESELGILPLQSPDPELHGPLLSYRMPGMTAEQASALFFKLKNEHGLQISIPSVKGVAYLRLSPHIYNTKAEIRRAVSILKRTAAQELAQN